MLLNKIWSRFVHKYNYVWRNSDWLASWHISTKSYQWQWKCGCSLTLCPGRDIVSRIMWKRCKQTSGSATEQESLCFEDFEFLYSAKNSKNNNILLKKEQNRNNRKNRNSGRHVFIHTFTWSASRRKTSVEADPSRKNWPSVSFSRHMSRTARAVLPVSLREWTKINTCNKQRVKASKK